MPHADTEHALMSGQVKEAPTCSSGFLHFCGPTFRGH